MSASKKMLWLEAFAFIAIVRYMFVSAMVDGDVCVYMLQL